LVKVGLQLLPQHGSLESLRDLWRSADAEVDSIWLTDHQFPQWGDRSGGIGETWSLLSILAADTFRATVGTMVTCLGIRNPYVLARSAKTVRLIARDRFVLGVGAGWNSEDFLSTGTAWSAGRERVERFAVELGIINSVLDPALEPQESQIPVLIAANGSRMLRLTAIHAQSWNAGGPAEQWIEKSQTIDHFCRTSGRPISDIRRIGWVVTVSFEKDPPGPWSFWPHADPSSLTATPRRSSTLFSRGADPGWAPRPVEPLTNALALLIISE
jgi:alkanesulfonate monooxygenase SsuD/methylene tetrahydromethanopterin reductase-like flavin-dependent oxidoreductase (luciferase family)